jgi:hypothetical protein
MCPGPSTATACECGGLRRNFTGVEGAVENFTGLPTTRFTEQNPALCGIYFNRAIRVHGSPIDKEF